MKNEMRLSLLSLALLMLAGCASSERVVLLPSADGRASAVVVRDAKGELVLDQPYAGSVRSQGTNSAYRSTPEEVKERFGAALAAQPARPRSYTLYFQGGNQLTPESQAEFAKMRADVLAWSAPEIMVIGHTDRVGSVQSNDALSLKRAESVRALLIEAGIPAGKLEAVGRGEREPLVATADEVAEGKNRRVEINLR
ncbi:OmpA family protein [Quatrionicoccus australiensis]|uniref:OmpA family protein n=1 Tax=Quatrionicoccus australiensis TaxID=138118 RepID=UPI001CFA3AC2|nr:OmpA family protein [Quatrionicoccus australiensis]MCB4361701.1 OmpA family protein [Quatrionicoccus australiensis]